MRLCFVPNCSARHPVVLMKHSASLDKDLEIESLKKETEDLKDLVLEAIKLGECYDELRLTIKKPSQWGSSFKQRALEVLTGIKK